MTMTMLQPVADPRGYQRLDLSRGGVMGDLSDLRPREKVRIANREVSITALPRRLRNDPLGVVVPDWLDVRAMHRFPQPPFERFTMPAGEIVHPAFTEKSFREARPHSYVDNPRPIICGNGDYLVSVVAGDDHYAMKPIGWNVNDIFLYRSRDRGQTWDPPTVAPNTYSQHGWPLLRARRSGDGNRIVATYTMPTPGDYDGAENAGIAWRYSDDHGHTWSEPNRICPVNDPGFQGMWCIQPTETARGAWLIAPHAGHWERLWPEVPIVSSTLYLLRSDDGGESWEQYPGARPNGWQYQPAKRMDEGRPIALADGTLRMFARTVEGHLWMFRGSDDGRMWSAPRPVPALVHPDAPPMISTLSDGQTLLALIHNNSGSSGFASGFREELWVTLSRDAGDSWSEPRFLMTTSTCTTQAMWSAAISGCPYADTLADDGMLHIFVPHNWRQVLHVRLPEAELERLATASALA